jgi:hypothetical protein
VSVLSTETKGSYMSYYRRLHPLLNHMWCVSEIVRKVVRLRLEVGSF